MGEEKKTIADVLGEPGAIDLNTRDPLAEWFSENRHRVNQFLVLLALAALCFYGYKTFQDALQQRVADASDLFNKARAGYENYEKERQALALAQASTDADKETKIDQAKKNLTKAESSLNEMLTGLRESQPPYSRFADLYQARMSNSTQDLNLPNWSEQQHGSSSRLLSELQALLVARVLLDSDDQGKITKAHDALVALAKDAESVHANAAIILARIAATDEQRKEARELLESVKTKHPEQYDLVKPELERL